MDRLKLEYACENFLQIMRRECLRRFPDADVQTVTFLSYSPEDRSTLMKAVGSAVRAMNDEGDGFLEWKRRRASNSQ